MKTWDVAVSHKANGQAMVGLPSSVGRSLAKLGLNRATLELTEDGILLRPYAGENDSRRREEDADLPFVKKAES